MTHSDSSETVFSLVANVTGKVSGKTNVIYMVEQAEFVYQTGCDPTLHQYKSSNGLGDKQSHMVEI